MSRSVLIPPLRGYPHADTPATGAARQRRLAGTLAVAGPVAFVATSLVAWWAQDAYSPRGEDISALAALDAQQPWIMVAGFLALGAGLVVLGAGLVRAVAASRSARFGALLVVIAGVGILVAGIARNDCSSELAACKARVDAGDASWHHGLHDTASGLVFLALVGAQLVLARAFKRDPVWRDLRVYSLVSGALTLALLAMFIVEPIDGWNGLVQRLFLTVPFVWIGIVGMRLRGQPSGPVALAAAAS